MAYFHGQSECKYFQYYSVEEVYHLDEMFHIYAAQSQGPDIKSIYYYCSFSLLSTLQIRLLLPLGDWFGSA